MFKDRLKAARKHKNLRQTHLATAAGVSPQAVSGWERGEAMPEPDKLSIIARELGRSVDWLLADSDGGVSSEDVSAGLDRPDRPKIRVKGYVGAGGAAHFYAVSQGDLGEIEASDRDPANAAAVQIMGTSLGRFFDRWFAVYSDVRSPITEDLIGHLCVVGLEDDRVLIKKVIRAGKRFDLISNSEDEEPIRGVKIKWAAKVADIRQK